MSLVSLSFVLSQSSLLDFSQRLLNTYLTCLASATVPPFRFASVLRIFLRSRLMRGIVTIFPSMNQAYSRLSRSVAAGTFSSPPTLIAKSKPLTSSLFRSTLPPRPRVLVPEELLTLRTVSSAPVRSRKFPLVPRLWSRRVPCR